MNEIYFCGSATKFNVAAGHKQDVRKNFPFSPKSPEGDFQKVLFYYFMLANDRMTSFIH